MPRPRRHVEADKAWTRWSALVISISRGAMPVFALKRSTPRQALSLKDLSNLVPSA